MAYTKQTWADLPSKTTPINAERLTHIEDGIFNASQTADTAASTAGTAAANVGIVSGKVETLTERVNGLDTAVSNKVDKVAGKGLSTNDYNDTDKGKVDSLGTASTKNSTCVVTESSDLVESGAVKDIVGWGNKNKYDATGSNSTDGYGLTWTFNQITKEITVSGTPTAFKGYPTSSFKSIKAGNYIATVVGNMTNVCISSVMFIKDSILIEELLNGDNKQAFDFTIDPTLDFNKINVVLKRITNGVACSGSGYIMVCKAEEYAISPSYEPYHASVEESLEQKCDNSTIAPTENGTTASQAYAVNDVFIRNGALCKVTSAISQGDTLSNQFTVTNVGAILTALLNA